MDTIFTTYSSTIFALGATATLALIQLLVADVVGLSRKHTPGTPVLGGHDDALFRVTRTVANTNESIAIFVCAILFCILSSASPAYTAYAAWTYVCARTIYAVCYYSNLQTMRSICFVIVALSLLALILVGFLT